VYLLLFVSALVVLSFGILFFHLVNELSSFGIIFIRTVFCNLVRDLMLQTALTTAWTVSVCVCLIFFTVRRCALHGLGYRNSVCLYVHPSVTLRGLCSHGSTYDHDFFSPCNSSTILVFGILRTSQKSKGVTLSEDVE